MEIAQEPKESKRITTSQTWMSDADTTCDNTSQRHLESPCHVVNESTRTLTRFDTILILITNAVGLGVLSLPHALHTLGLIPGLISIIGMGLLTGYTAYVFLQFYRCFPQIVNVADIGRIIGGQRFEWLVGGLLIAMLCLCGASCVLTLSIGLNFITGHGLCTITFIGLATIVSWALCVPRSMKFCAYMGYPATISIITAVIMVMVSVGIDGPSNAPTKDFIKEIRMFGNPTFTEGMIAILNVAFAFAGAQSFITIMAEMTDPTKDFIPALVSLQAFGVTIYCTVAAVLYSFAAQHITSPALSSASPVIAKASYGVVFPCVLGSAIVFGNSTIKYLFTITMRGLGAEKEECERHSLKGCTKRSWMVWIGWGVVYWICSFVLANSIPVFYSILSIGAALFVAWFSFGLAAVAYLYINKKSRFTGIRKAGLTLLNLGILGAAIFMNVGGMYAAIVELMKLFNDPNNSVNGAFTCADNGQL